MNEEQRSIIDPIIYKYEELAYGMTHEELEKEAVQEALLTINMMGFKPNKAMKKANTKEELFTAFADYMQAEMEKMATAKEKNNKSALPDWKINHQRPRRKK